jgi:glycosyltransferase involved in cell wall biosynthesis
MRIALVSPLYESVPPNHYGGTERVIAALADELVAQGHHVSLFASGGSRTNATLVPVVPAPLRTTMSRTELIEVAPHLHLQMLADVYRSSRQFDIVHAHTDIWTLPFIRSADVPTVITMHGRLDLDTVQRVFPLYPDTPLVSVSDAQRAPLDHFPMRWIGTVHNGLPLDRYLAASEHSGARDYLAFIGRLTPEKRPDLAVEVARRAGLPLRVAAKVDPLDEDYWREEIQPLFEREGVEYLGELSEHDKPAFLAGARAMVFPIDWPEPFGLVMIESLAAGTPVVALRRGSVPEIVHHGISGWIADDVDDMVRGVEVADRFSRHECRRRAQDFTAERMAKGYVRIYHEVIARHRSGASADGGRRFAGADG